MALPAECELCAKDDGNYDFGRVCCRARFITSLPMVHLRRGWMARWKTRESAGLYAEIERAVTARWKNKKGDAVIAEAGNVR